MGIIFSVILGIVSSIVASAVFWYVFFRISQTNVEFSPIIAKSKSTGEYPGDIRYRIKLINSGYRDLIEITMLVKISIKMSKNKASNYTYIGIGNESMLPLLRGRRYQYRSKGLSCAHTLTLYPIETTIKEFQKDIYTEFIVKQAKEGALCLDDIFNEYGTRVKLTVFLYGNDELTGARRMFKSKVFKIEDTEFGKYAVSEPLKSRKIKYKQYVNETLALVKDTNMNDNFEFDNSENNSSADIESL